jgi:hypothetical protein
MFDIELAEKHSLETGDPLSIEGDFCGIPVRYICTSDKGWVVPITDISKALGIPKQTQSDILKRSKFEFESFLTQVRVTRTSEQVANINLPCLTRDGIVMYLMKLTPSRMNDPNIGKRISEFQIFVVKTFGEYLDYVKIPQWWLRREIAKMRYKPMTDAVHDHLVPLVPEDKRWLVYATEADLLNVIVFGKTAKEAGCNQRETASQPQLDFLVKLEESNETLIRIGMSINDRYNSLCKIRDDLISHGRLYLNTPEEKQYKQYINY